MALDMHITKQLNTFTLESTLNIGNEVVGLLGASGCGKSMTMRSVAGIEKPDSGHITVNGIEYFNKEKHINLSPQKRQTALLFQNYQLFPHMTVAQNIAAGIHNATATEKQQRIDEQVKRFGLKGLEQRHPLQLSGGQQQRVALARMLAAQPAILLLDEPLSALDAHLKRELEADLNTLFKMFGKTVLYVSHDIDEATRLCDKIAVVHDGHIQEISTPQQLMENPRSLPGLRLSGCRNLFPVQAIDEHRVRSIRANTTIEVRNYTPGQNLFAGIRETDIVQLDNPIEQNCLCMRVASFIDSRYARDIRLEAAQDASVRDATENPLFLTSDEKETFSLFWRINRADYQVRALPVVGDVVYVHVKPENVHVLPAPPVYTTKRDSGKRSGGKRNASKRDES